MKTFTSAVALIAALIACGCSSNNNTPKARMNMSDTDAQQLQPPPGEIKDAASPKLSADTHFAAGQLAETTGALASALKEYNAALKIDPHHMPTLFRIGIVYTEARQFDQAIDAWKTYLKATDYSATAYGNLGFCYEVSGQPDQAEANYRKGLEKEPLNLLCRNNYGLMLAHQKRIPEALKMWEPVLKPAEIHYNLGSVYESMGHNREARIEYQKALDVDPKFNDAKSRLAQVDMN